jgi:hypothetical protein
MCVEKWVSVSLFGHKMCRSTFIPSYSVKHICTVGGQPQIFSVANDRTSH